MQLAGGQITWRGKRRKISISKWNQPSVVCGGRSRKPSLVRLSDFFTLPLKGTDFKTKYIAVHYFTTKKVTLRIKGCHALSFRSSPFAVRRYQLSYEAFDETS